QRVRQPTGPAPVEVLTDALPGFLEEEESVLVAADMIQNMSDTAMTVMITQFRMIVLEGNVLWSSPLESTHVIYNGGERSHLRLLVERVSDTQTITPGPATASPSDERRLVLRPTSDPAAAEDVHRRLTSSGGQLYDAWPEEL
ncbi:MAG: hypothetical protein J2O46_06385, partial [Nocardioides sp.]|nr:hypothetical protein [Nocardioides sp.]